MGFSVKEIPFMNSCIEYVFLTFDNDNENSEVSTLSLEDIFFTDLFLKLTVYLSNTLAYVCMVHYLKPHQDYWVFFFLGFNHYRLLIRYHIMQAFTLE